MLSADEDTSTELEMLCFLFFILQKLLFQFVAVLPPSVPVNAVSRLLFLKCSVKLRQVMQVLTRNCFSGSRARFSFQFSASSHSRGCLSFQLPLFLPNGAGHLSSPSLFFCQCQRSGNLKTQEAQLILQTTFLYDF